MRQTRIKNRNIMNRHSGYNVLNRLRRNRGELVIREMNENFNDVYDDNYGDTDDYYVEYFEEFEPNTAVEMMHKMPRLGHIDNIVYASSANKEETTQYYYGVISMSVLLFLVFLVWSIVLLLLKILGPSKFGCSSGHIYKLSNVEIQQQWYKKRLSRIRLTFLICAGGVLLTSGVMIYLGLIPLNTTYGQMMENTNVSYHLISMKMEMFSMHELKNMHLFRIIYIYIYFLAIANKA